MTASSSQNIWAGARRHLPADGATPTSALLLLHGLGADADDLFGIAPLMAKALPHTVFLSPNAPQPCDMAPYGRQWFSLLDRSPFNVISGIEASAPVLTQMIADVQAEFALPMNRIALFGFSQGCMMSLYVAPRLPESLGAVVGCSGALMAPERLEAELKSRPPILLTHGQMDPVVPYPSMPMAEMALVAAGFDVQTVTRPMMAHGIDDETLDAATHFLQRHIG